MATKTVNIRGPQGVQGDPGATGLAGPRTTSADANNLAGLGSDSLLYVPGAARSGNAGLLNQVSGNTGDFVDGTNHCQNLATAVKPTIWSVRQNSFNSIGNPNFEIDQRNIFAGVTITGSTWAQDRWQWVKNGGTTMAATAVPTVGSVLVPGTNYGITGKFLRITLTAQQASLAAADIIWSNQYIEGPFLRELIGGVHSIQALVRSSVAGLTFGVALRDVATANSLTKLGTIASANTWTLVPFPNLPTWAPGGTWALTPGTQGYTFSITLACGTTYSAPANDTWQSGNFVGAAGQANFAAQAVNSTFDVAFVQHEPGSLCTQPMDLDFINNLRACQRYFAKSTGYTQTIPTSNQWKEIGKYAYNQTVRFNVQFPVDMAKNPTVTIYDNGTNAGYLYLDGAGSVALSGTLSTHSSGVQNSLIATQTVNQSYPVLGQWKADTGW